jgi:quinol-cytochrome oxidoreductase complex cytochrome b subunit
MLPSMLSVEPSSEYISLDDPSFYVMGKMVLENFKYYFRSIIRVVVLVHNGRSIFYPDELKPRQELWNGGSIFYPPC